MTIKPRAKRILAAIAGLLAVTVAGILFSGWQAFGAGAQGQRLERMEASPQWSDGVFANPQELYNDVWTSLTSWTELSDAATPRAEVPTVPSDGSQFATPPASGLRVTWFGHSSSLIELDGARFLVDPIWGERSSPFTWVGPERWYPPPIALENLPDVDAVIISHDHYDHLDYPTMVRMRDWDTTFIAPIGVGAHLEYWGIPAERIVELDWWETTQIGDVVVNCVPSRHASGRFVTDYMAKLWAGYALVGPKHRLYYSGDTGLFPAMKDIGERLGPFDLTMIEVGAYHRAWPDWHIGPEQAVKAHHIVGGKVFMPVHWGLWNLAMHGWTEPAERVLAAAKLAGTVLAMPRPGESVEPGNLAPLQKWWPDEPWQTAAEHPIQSTKVDGL